ncbi:hypothetical protein [Streptomyces sp.]
MRMPAIGDVAGRDRAASKARCSPACVASIAVVMAGSDRSRPPDTQLSTNTARKAVPVARSGGTAPTASP